MINVFEYDKLKSGTKQIVMASDNLSVLIAPEVGGRIVGIQEDARKFLHRTYPRGEEKRNTAIQAKREDLSLILENKFGRSLRRLFHSFPLCVMSRSWIDCLENLLTHRRFLRSASRKTIADEFGFIDKKARVCNRHGLFVIIKFTLQNSEVLPRILQKATHDFVLAANSAT